MLRIVTVRGDVEHVVGPAASVCRHRLAEADIVHGGPHDPPEESYGPGLKMRRDQTASFLARTAELATGQDLHSQTQQFDDVPPGNTHFATVGLLFVSTDETAQ